MSARPDDYAPVKCYSTNEGLVKGMIYARTSITAAGRYRLEEQKGDYDPAYFDVLESPTPDRCNWLDKGRKVIFRGAPLPKHVQQAMLIEYGYKMPDLTFEGEYTINGVQEHFMEPGWFMLEVAEHPDVHYAAIWFEPKED